MSRFTLLEVTAASVPTPPAGKATIFLDTATGLPSYKDDAGVVHSFVGASGGPGQPGVPLFQAEDGEDGLTLPGVPGPGGGTGPIGPQGEHGAGPLLMQGDDGEDGMIGPPGPAGTGSAAAASGMKLLGTYTGTGVAAINVVTRNASGESGAIFQSDCHSYLIIIRSLILATNTANALMEVSVDGGSNYATSGYLTTALLTRLSTTTRTDMTSASSIVLFQSYGTGVTRDKLSMQITAFDMLGANEKHFDYGGVSTSSDGNWYGVEGQSIYSNASPVNAFRVKASTGNVDGEILVYGYKT